MSKSWRGEEVLEASLKGLVGLMNAPNPNPEVTRRSDRLRMAVESALGLKSEYKFVVYDIEKWMKRQSSNADRLTGLLLIDALCRESRAQSLAKDKDGFSLRFSTRLGDIFGLLNTFNEKETAFVRKLTEEWGSLDLFPADKIQESVRLLKHYPSSSSSTSSSSTISSSSNASSSLKTSSLSSSDLVPSINSNSSSNNMYANSNSSMNVSLLPPPPSTPTPAQAALLSKYPSNSISNSNLNVNSGGAVHSGYPSSNLNPNSTLNRPMNQIPQQMPPSNFNNSNNITSNNSSNSNSNSNMGSNNVSTKGSVVPSSRKDASTTSIYKRKLPTLCPYGALQSSCPYVDNNSCKYNHSSETKVYFPTTSKRSRSLLYTNYNDTAFDNNSSSNNNNSKLDSSVNVLNQTIIYHALPLVDVSSISAASIRASLNVASGLAAFEDPPVNQNNQTSTSVLSSSILTSSTSINSASLAGSSIDCSKLIRGKLLRKEVTVPSISTNAGVAMSTLPGGSARILLGTL